MQAQRVFLLSSTGRYYRNATVSMGMVEGAGGIFAATSVFVAGNNILAVPSSERMEKVGLIQVVVRYIHCVPRKGGGNHCVKTYV